MHTFTIPGKPVAKGRPRLGKFGTYTPEKTVNYESKVYLAAVEAKVPMLEGPVWVELAIWFEWPKSKHRKREPLGRAWHTGRPDCDNVQKAVADGAEGVCWRDDAQICQWKVWKRYCAQGEQARVVVEYGSLEETR